jgi:hypothetical protein
LALGFSEPVIVFGKGKMPGKECIIVKLNSENDDNTPFNGRGLYSEED